MAKHKVIWINALRKHWLLVIWPDNDIETIEGYGDKALAKTLEGLA